MRNIRAEVIRALRGWGALYSPPPKSKMPEQSDGTERAKGMESGKYFSVQECKPKSARPQLHQALNRLVDLVLVMGEAADRHDVAALEKATRAFIERAVIAANLSAILAREQ